ncbi:MAG: tRNA (N6-isopentenyl adenosine(37)-C2)-methylthiotransferase MiaB [Nitrospirae bacterium]|nr:tRNA (N6-isopentenyl adenosine(37)-C2)-methylthiotransferase MiaB [Nitrospirota bacterium]
MRSYKVLTFGCQMNEHDSEKMSGLLAAEGLMKSDTAEDADLIIINTCSIREKAEQKFFSEVGKLKELKAANPGLVIAVSGCIAQQEGRKILRRAPHVDLIFGNQNIKDLPDLLAARAAGTREVRTDFPEAYEHELLPAVRTGTVSSFVNIMFGCDNFCSYCVVPHVRGREKSRRPSDIVAEITTLVAGGCREVTLLGQNVNSYGRGLEGTDACTFPELLEMVDGIDGLERIRFVTSHPKDLSDSLVEAMARLPKVCENIHLPLQSASDSVLAGMNRKYTFASYMEKLGKLRAAMPGITLSTDIIVGFPGETEEDYRMTVDALESIRYDSIFSFKYSERPNTKALKMPGHLPEGVKSARLDHVIDLQNRITEEKNAGCVGKTYEVLVERPDKTGDAGRVSGKTRGGKIVNFAGGVSLVGRLVTVRITEGKKHSLVGEMV